MPSKPPRDDHDYIKYEELNSPTTHQPKRAANRRYVILIAVASLLLTAANVAIWTYTPRGPRDALTESWNECGRSSEEAMRRGCVMEPLFYGWMPPQCVYRELSNQFPVFEDRKYWLEPTFTTEVPPADLWHGKNIKVFTNHYHGEHCLFQWRKIMWAIGHNEAYVDNKTLSVGHTSHCADQMSTLAGIEGDNAIVEVEVGFYKCRNAPWAK